MAQNPTNRAIRWLRNREKNRRVLAVFTLVLGAVMIAVGVWTLQSSGSSMVEIIDAFADEPGYLLPLVSMVTTLQIKGEILLLGGILLVVFGIIRLFIPDSKTAILLALIDETQIDHKGNNDGNA